MEINRETKYTYNDMFIVPAKESDIESRKECNPYYEDGFLPLFTAPMTSVVDASNYKTFEENGIHSIIPRPVNLYDRLYGLRKGYWAAFSLSEFEDIFVKEDSELIKSFDKPIKVLIDVANGHMTKIFNLVRKAKVIFGYENIIIMIGNIANPETYKSVAKCGADFVRIGVGGGFGCITATQTGVHYPMASLIADTVEIRNKMIKEHMDESSMSDCDMDYDLYYVKSLPKIVADGGIRNFDDINKALALGADYVMIGSVFSKMYEAAGIKTYETKEENKKMRLNFPEQYFENVRCVDDKYWYGDYTDEAYENLFKKLKNKPDKKNHSIGCLYKTYYGMASKKGQIDLNGKKEQISEGTIKTVQVEYTMEKWIERFVHYIRSAMSYTNCRTLQEFKVKPKLILCSGNATFAVNK